MSLLSPLYSPIINPLKHEINRFWLNKTPAEVSRDTLLFILVLYYGKKISSLIREKGLKKSLFNSLLYFSKLIPGANKQITAEKDKIINKLESFASSKDTAGEKKYYSIPSNGLPAQQLLTLLKRWQTVEESHWNKGQVSGNHKQSIDSRIQV
jgi:hypothetical protein